MQIRNSRFDSHFGNHRKLCGLGNSMKSSSMAHRVPMLGAPFDVSNSSDSEAEEIGNFVVFTIGKEHGRLILMVCTQAC
jgi:hypothetical protein